MFKTDHGEEITEVLELPENRLLVVVRRPVPVTQLRAGSESAVWAVPISSSGAARKSPQRLTDWRRDDILRLSVSTDGKRLAFLSEARQSDVYVARFDPRAEHIETPQPLTLDDWDDAAQSWTPDSSTLLISSNRNTMDIFKRRLDSDVEEPLVVEPGDQYRPEVTSDGQWVLYVDLRPPARIMRIPISGGTPEPVVTALNSWAIPRCSFRGRCVLEQEESTTLVISALDPLRGKGAELGRISTNVAGWCLLPDGNGGASLLAAANGRRLSESNRSSDIRRKTSWFRAQPAWTISIRCRVG